METSLDLSLSKDITEKIENLETEKEVEIDENNIILFAQALETKSKYFNHRTRSSN